MQELLYVLLLLFLPQGGNSLRVFISLAVVMGLQIFHYFGLH
jgi:hypothetical protein